MIACPGCKRRIITSNDVLFASLDGAMRCRVCGKLGRLDLISRWILACMLALSLPMVLLYTNVFYSGHLFIVSLAVILIGWRALAAIGLPLLGLELVPTGACLNRRQSIITLTVIVAAALVLDGFMAYRIETDEARASTHSASSTEKPR